MVSSLWSSKLCFHDNTRSKDPNRCRRSKHKNDSGHMCIYIMRVFLNSWYNFLKINVMAVIAMTFVAQVAPVCLLIRRGLILTSLSVNCIYCSRNNINRIWFQFKTEKNPALFNSLIAYGCSTPLPYPGCEDASTAGSLLPLSGSNLVFKLLFCSFGWWDWR